MRDHQGQEFCMPRVVALRKVAAELSEYWSPRIVGEVDDSYVKVAKIKGGLTWHKHEGEDELFLVLRGHLRIEMEHESVELEREKCSSCPRECAITQSRQRSAIFYSLSGSRRRIREMWSRKRPDRWQSSWDASPGSDPLGDGWRISRSLLPSRSERGRDLSEAAQP